jgi:hypothetical protein
MLWILGMHNSFRGFVMPNNNSRTKELIRAGVRAHGFPNSRSRLAPRKSYLSWCSKDSRYPITRALRVRNIRAIASRFTLRRRIATR